MAAQKLGHGPVLCMSSGRKCGEGGAESESRVFRNDSEDPPMCSCFWVAGNQRWAELNPELEAWVITTMKPDRRQCIALALNHCNM